MRALGAIKPKVWNYWIPKLPGLTYTVHYLPKRRRDLLRKSVFLVRMSYLATSYFYCVPKGLQLALHNGNSLNVMVGNKKTKLKAKPFITSMLISILGLTFRFRIYLRVRGLGYKAYVINSGKTLNLKLGLSHTVTFNFTGQMHALKLGQKERMFSIETDNWIVLTNTVSRIRNIKKIDYYRGKGIFKKFFTCKIKQLKKKK